MALSLVSEDTGIEHDFMLSETQHGARGTSSHAHYDLHQGKSPAPAALFPTAEVVAVLTAIGAVLGARFALLLGGCGALFLAYLSMTAPNQASLWAQTIFSLTVFIPLVWLSATRRI